MQGAGKSYEIAVIFSDTPASAARELAGMFKLPVVINDIEDFCIKRGAKRTDMRVREQFDAFTATALAGYNPDIIMMAGYASLVSAPLLERYLVVNLHLADLSLRDASGNPLFPGLHPVADVIASGLSTVAASTHIAVPEMDQGPVLMISNQVLVEADVGQTEARLKQEAGRLVKNTVEWIAEGRFAREGETVFCDARPTKWGLPS